MKIKAFPIKIKDLFKGYKDNSIDETAIDDSVVAYNGKLNVRPAYQREFIYKEEKQKAVINTIMNNRPLNIMYWAQDENGNYEVLDGQQRTLSICRFLDHKFSIKFEGESVLWDNDLFKEELEKIYNYELLVYVCYECTATEKLEWFKTINISGEPLKPQEMLNASYTGTWLSDAKYHFSRAKTQEAEDASLYIKGEPDRQDYLATVISWACDRDKLNKNDDYMALHEKDANANDLVKYFNDIIKWIDKLFKKYDNTMKGVNWGILYNKYHNNVYNADDIQEIVDKCLADYDVTRKSGIYEYALTGDERLLSIRDFSLTDKKSAYNDQNKKCKICGKEFAFKDMHGDHIVPWSKGGRTEKSNLQMLCTKCNLAKSDHDIVGK